MFVFESTLNAPCRLISALLVRSSIVSTVMSHFRENGSSVCICFVDSDAEWGVAWVYTGIGRECANIFDTYTGFPSFPENNVSYDLRISRFRAE